MTIAATTIRVPRARGYIEAVNGSTRLVDMGRLDAVSVKIEGDPTITEEFDPTNCIRYESGRSYLRPTCMISMECASVDVAAMVRALLADAQTVAAGAKTYTTGTAMVAGDLIDLGVLPAGSRSTGAFVPTAWTAEDSAGTPASFVEDTNWEWYDPAAGIIKILDVDGFTQPFVFSGNSRASARAVLGDAMGDTYALTIAAVDQSSACTGEKLKVWKAMATPGTEALLSQALSSDEPGVLTLTFGVLPDTTQAATATLGRFGYWERG